MGVPSVPLFDESTVEIWQEYLYKQKYHSGTITPHFLSDVAPPLGRGGCLFIVITELMDNPDDWPKKRPIVPFRSHIYGCANCRFVKYPRFYRFYVHIRGSIITAVSRLFIFVMLAYICFSVAKQRVKNTNKQFS